jgi:hypothetical protein
MKADPFSLILTAARSVRALFPGGVPRQSSVHGYALTLA